MSGITSMGTTYTLPNYTGVLHALTPADTPFFSALGGLGGGGQSTSVEYEWQTYDLRNAGQNVALEGADAPTAQERVRGNVTNVSQIHQEKVSVSYTKQAAIGQKSGTNNAATNPITNEIDWQTLQMLKQMVRDVEYSFINGFYQKPTDNTTARKTRGLIAAVTTNASTHATLTITGLSAATDTVTETSTALANGDKIVFTDAGGSAGLTQGRVYFVVNKATNSFKVSLTSGGAAVTIGTATVAYNKPWTTDLTTDVISQLCQDVYDNGGLQEQFTATLMVNSVQKRAVTKAYASAFGQFQELSRVVGGVNVSTLITDFGTLNVMLDRFVPQDAVIAVSLDQCGSVYLEIPGKGHFFAEPLARVGAADNVQLYGEVGLAYGSEKSHGIVRGLKV